MVVSSDGQTPAQLRTSLRLAPGRQSYTGGALSNSSPKPPAPMRSSSVRVSSPGMLGAAGGSNSNSPKAAAIPSGFGTAGAAGDLPRLPYVSENGDKNARPPASVMLRRASTVNTIHLHRDTQPGHAPAKDTSGPESTAALKRERNALRIDKNALLLNKKRLEAFLNKLLEQVSAGGQGEEEEREARASQEGGSSGGSGRLPMLLRSSTLRAQILKVLDESSGLERQLGGASGGGAGGGGGASASGDLVAKMAEMQAEHDMVVGRLESELSYRRTQAAAATSSIQKQLTETQEELTRVRQQLAAAEAQIREFHGKGSDLREQVQKMNAALAERTTQLAEARELLGMDKNTMSTVIEMLKEQLRDANADRSAKARHITDLERAIVHRDNLLTEAHNRINQAAAQAAAAAAAGVSSSAAVARVAASMTAPLDVKGAWGGYSPGGHNGRLGVGPSKGAAGAGGLRSRHTTHGGGGGGGNGTGAGDGAMGRRLSDQDSYSLDRFEAEDVEV